MEREVEEYREEIHYLKNKLETKYDVIEDLEHDLDQIEGQLKAEEWSQTQN